MNKNTAIYAEIPSETIPPKPIPLPVSIDAIPAPLRERRQWVVWKYEWRSDKSGKGKWSKPPYNAKTDRYAKSTDPSTWTDFDTAVRVYRAGGYDGIGFAFHDGDGLCGVDLDHAIDTETGELEPWALQILAQFRGTYAERSPSGTGFRIFAYGNPVHCGKRGNVEFYSKDSARYLTVTGDHWAGSATTVTAQPEAIQWLDETYFAPKDKPEPSAKPKDFHIPAGDDGAVIERATKAKNNGSKFAALMSGDFSGYPSQSEADAALCSLLAFWTDKNAEQIDRIFRGSGLTRDKWDVKHHADGQTYGQSTIESALRTVGKTYGDTLRQRGERLRAKAGGEPKAPSQDASWPRAEWRPETITDVGDTDMGNAQRIFDRCGCDLLFVREVGWHDWSDTRWTSNEAGAKRRADELPRLVLAEAAALLDQAAKETDQRNRKEMMDRAGLLQYWAKKCEKSSAIEAALQMLERRLIIEPTEADADPFLLAVGNGTLDLRTGQLRQSKRGDFITKGASIEFDPTATCPTFEAFMARIFRSHPEVIGFLRRAIGYTLTGDTREQCLFILWGGGSNGKSTLVGVLENLLGDYAKQAAPDLLLAKTGDRHPTEIADLRGARLVATVETGEGRRMAESLVKQMSGGDRMKGRYMRRDFFEFMPTFKLWMATNHKPTIRGTDHGIWRRLRLVPFVETIADDEKDPALPAKLRAELPGILAWAVRGCLEWRRDGLKPPDVVKAATDAYRAEQDVLATFLDECCAIDRRAEVKVAALYKAYTDWCEQMGEYAEKQRKFGESLMERGIERDKGTGGARIYRGIGLLLDSGASGASGADFPKDARKDFSSSYTQNRATSATRATNSTARCSACVHWSDRCGKSKTVSDPSAARLCDDFAVLTDDVGRI